MNKVLLQLTNLVIRSQNGKFVRTETIRISDNFEQEVAIFSGDNVFLGQCTPFKTVVINESVLSNERIRDYVLIHEFAHTKQWWFYFSIPLAFVLLFSFFSFLLAVIYLVQSITSTNWSYIIEFMFWLSTSLISFAIPCLFSWMLEFDAEFAAINSMGLDTFIEIRRDIRQNHSPSLYGRVIRRLTHPTDRITVCVWKWFHKTQ
jgi:hypothetical protein